MRSTPDNAQIGRLLSHILRHEAVRYGLHPDSRGRVNVDDLLHFIQKRPEYHDFTLETLQDAIAADTKNRFELSNGTIRARYGHSFNVTLQPIIKSHRVPEILYHGTNVDALPAIMQEGLKPMGRTRVHLTPSFQTAVISAERKHRPIVILAINTAKLKKKIEFYGISEDVWLCSHVPSRYLSITATLNKWIPQVASSSSLCHSSNAPSREPSPDRTAILPSYNSLPVTIPYEALYSWRTEEKIAPKHIIP